MSFNLIFWAQALDNSSNDYLEERNKEIADVKIRNELSGKFFTIKQTGETFYKEDNFELTKNRDSILIKLNSNEKDIQGRVAPVLCLCENAFLNVNGFCSEFKKAMESGSGGFADRVKRSFNEENVKEICSELKRKNLRNNKTWFVAILCFLGLSWLVYKF